VNYLFNLYVAWQGDDNERRRGFLAEGRESAWGISHEWQMAMYAGLYKALGGGWQEETATPSSSPRNE
jgi:hypothetical protein